MRLWPGSWTRDCSCHANAVTRPQLYSWGAQSNGTGSGGVTDNYDLAVEYLSDALLRLPALTPGLVQVCWPDRWKPDFVHGPVLVTASRVADKVMVVTAPEWPHAAEPNP